MINRYEAIRAVYFIIRISMTNRENPVSNNITVRVSASENFIRRFRKTVITLEQ